MRSPGQSTAFAFRVWRNCGTENLSVSKNFASGQKRTVVPVVRGATLPITASGETSLPDWKPIACSLPPRRTRQSRRLESAFTTDTPTPCRPPEKP